jgi:putative inorganic carbon (HCO3(-)) transporter
LLDNIQKRWVYLSTGVFIVLNSLLIWQEFFWFPAIIGVLLIGLFAFFASDKLLLLIAFLTPLSIDLDTKLLSAGISLPSEALMIVLAAIFCLRILKHNEYDIRITKHPISIAIIIYLIWIFITSLTSEFPLVSFKSLAAKLWFILSFYFFAILVFKKGRIQIRNFIWLYSISMIFVILYTVYNHSTYGFDKSVGHWVMRPFYNDHTSYGAALAMYSIAMIGLLFEEGYSRTKKMLLMGIGLVLLIGLFFSYSRAAWISVVGALGVFFILKFKIKYYWIFSFALLSIGLFFVFQNEIIQKLSKNNQDSSTDFVEHVQSISNISTDASNLERLNRWDAALKLFYERPIVGWGPGTYQFVYAPFQHSKNRTIISTNAGDGGNAHSEYIGPLAETGIVGLLTFLLIIALTLYYANVTYFKTPDKNVKLLVMISIMALVTYYIHGFLNNFLDTDKLSVPFWGFTAIIVTLNLYGSNEKDKPY